MLVGGNARGTTAANIARVDLRGAVAGAGTILARIRAVACNVTDGLRAEPALAALQRMR